MNDFSLMNYLLILRDLGVAWRNFAEILLFWGSGVPGLFQKLPVRHRIGVTEWPASCGFLRKQRGGAASCCTAGEPRDLFLRQ